MRFMVYRKRKSLKMNTTRTSHQCLAADDIRKISSEGSFPGIPLETHRCTGQAPGGMR